MSRPERIEESLPALEAFLNYSVDTGEKPASYGGISSAEADKKRTGKYQEHKMAIHDGRAVADKLSLEREGFILVRHETKVKDFYDETEVCSVYYPEIEQLVKETSGAKRVLVFDHTLRSADNAMREAKQISGPVRNAHNDYTEWSGPQRVRDLLPNEAEELLKHRFAVVRCGVPFAMRSNESHWRLPMQGALAHASFFPARAFIRTASVKCITAASILSIAGITFRTCSATRRWFSKLLTQAKMAGRVGLLTPLLTIPPAHRTRRRAKVLKCAR